jgi:glucokinase
MTLLVGDIGGTKTRLGIYSKGKGPLSPLQEMTLPSGDYPNLETLINFFLKKTRVSVVDAIFGVAGPVIGGRHATITNLPWEIDREKLEDALGLHSLHLINDVEATAQSVPLLSPGDLYILNEGKAEAGGTIAVIAPGTGLGEAFLTWEGLGYRAHATEGGHVDFGPGSSLEIDLLRYLLEKMERVSYERICSGIGLPNIYSFLKERLHRGEPSWLTEQLQAAQDPTPVIIRAALEGQAICETCVQTLGLFAKILGAEAGNLALKVLATGGVYLGGGLPPRILPFLAGEGFKKSFTQKGRLTPLLMNIPVYVILNAQAGLMGAASRGFELMED